MNEENLISLADRTPEDRKRIASMGGTESGRKRHEKAVRMKNFRGMAEYYLELQICDELIDDYLSWVRHRRYLRDKQKREERKALREQGINPKEVEKQEAENKHRYYYKKTSYEQQKYNMSRNLHDKVVFNGNSFRSVARSHGLKY